MKEQEQRRSLGGVWTPLRNGGVLKLLPRNDNLAYQEKMRRSEDEIRLAKGITPETPLIQALGHREFMEHIYRCQVGTVVTGWRAFDREDGEEIRCRREDGSLDEEAGLEVLLSPGVGSDFLDAIEEIDSRHARRREALEKNSSAPSAGNSATVGEPQTSGQ